MSVAPETDFTTGAQLYGVKRYRFSDTGGASLALVYHEDDQGYSLRGGRVTSASITAEVGQIARMSVTIEGDNLTAETTTARASLPASGAAPAITPIKSLLSPVDFLGTQYPTRTIEVDFGIAASQIDATDGANGRGGFDLTGQDPTIAFEPLRSDATLNLKRELEDNLGRASIQLGSGDVDAGVLNSIGIHCEQAGATEVTRQDENGRYRNRVVLGAFDPGEFSEGVDSYKLQLCRG